MILAEFAAQTREAQHCRRMKRRAVLHPGNEVALCHAPRGKGQLPRFFCLNESLGAHATNGSCIARLLDRSSQQIGDFFRRSLISDVLEAALDLRPLGPLVAREISRVLLERLVQNSDEEEIGIRTSGSFGKQLKNKNVSALRLGRSEEE